MRIAGITPRGGQGFPRTYGPGNPALPHSTRHGYPQAPRPGPAPEFGLLLTGQPMSDPRPRGPMVAGPPMDFPIPAITGPKLPGGVGTDLFDPTTWQRPYTFNG